MSLFDKFDRTILRNVHIEHESTNKSPDSLEIGTPGKGGVIKIYGDFSNPEAFRQKIENALELRDYANSKVYGSTNKEAPL